MYPISLLILGSVFNDCVVFYGDVFKSPPLRLASRRSIWSDVTPVDTNYAVERTGRLLWSPTLLLPTLLSDGQVSIFLVIHGLWNCFRIGQTQSSSCDCGQWQTMNHIVDTCPLTKFDGELNLLHEADDDAVIWLECTATAAFAKYNKIIAKLLAIFNVKSSVS